MDEPILFQNSIDGCSKKCSVVNGYHGMCQNCSLICQSKALIDSVQRKLSLSLKFDPNEPLMVEDNYLNASQLKDVQRILNENTKKLGKAMDKLRSQNRKLNFFLYKERASIGSERNKFHIKARALRHRMEKTRKEIQKLRSTIAEAEDLLQRGMERFTQRLRK